MKVYVLTKHYGDSIVGVYSTKEKAEKAYLSEDDYHFIKDLYEFGYDIDCYIIDRGLD